jgi:hypothetical protein
MGDILTNDTSKIEGMEKVTVEANGLQHQVWSMAG